MIVQHFPGLRDAVFHDIESAVLGAVDLGTRQSE